MALFAAPIVAIAVIALAASGVFGTLGQLTASITNTENRAVTKSAGLTERQGNVSCPATANGQWTPCGTVNKYGNAVLTPPNNTTSQTVTLTNTGNTTADLFLLPSACSDSLTGAGGELCNLATVTVSCTNGGSLGPLLLNTFFAGRSFPTGYSMGTIDASQTIECTFTLTLTGGTIPQPGGTISQPLAWKLVA